MHCQCGEDISPERKQLGYDLCLTCGEAEAKRRKFTVAPMHKSNYMLFTDVNLLKQLNPKRS